MIEPYLHPIPEGEEEFGRYRLLGRLARGGMADIFLARSASLDGFEKTLVIKRMRQELSDDAEFFSMFIDEARISIGFQHPNIVQVYDFGCIEGSYYLAMEYVPGCDLGSLLLLDGIRGKGLDPGLCLVILTEVLRGLDYAHEFRNSEGELLDVVHRDISPGNIMLCEHGAVKVADFGVAHSRGQRTPDQPGMVFGKLAYMPPEQACGEPADRRSDIFAAGVLLWEMLVGRHPYAASDETLTERVLAADIPAPSTEGLTLPAGFDALLLKAVAKSPDDRYQRALDFGEAAYQLLVQHYPQHHTFALQKFLAAHQQGITELSRRAAGVQTRPEQADVFDGGATEVWRSVLSDGVLRPEGDTLVTKALVVPSSKGKTSRVWPEEFLTYAEEFRQMPNLWSLVHMAEVCRTQGQPDVARACLRAAAVMFASAGLMAQALYCVKLGAASAQVSDWVDDLGHLPEMAVVRRDIRKYLGASPKDIQVFLSSLLADLPSSDSVLHRGTSTPLLRYLASADIAAFAQYATLKTFAPGEMLLRQGEHGHAMYLIARGRVLVHTTGNDGQRINLSSLMAGDVLGEIAFFSGTERSANAEAVSEVAVFEIDAPLYERIMETNPEAEAVLLNFYKERIVDTLLARSWVFGSLPPKARGHLSQAFDLRTYGPGEVIIRQGDRDHDIFIVKSGAAQAEVSAQPGGGGDIVSSALLRPGSLFGELAALGSGQRTATVVALGPTEVLQLDGKTFIDTLQAYPDVANKVRTMASERLLANREQRRAGKEDARPTY